MPTVSTQTKLVKLALCATTSIALSTAILLYLPGQSVQAQNTVEPTDNEEAPAVVKKPEPKPAVKKVAPPPATIEVGGITLPANAKQLSNPETYGFGGVVEEDNVLRCGKHNGTVLINQELKPGKSVTFDMNFGPVASVVFRPGLTDETLNGVIGSDPGIYSLTLAANAGGTLLTLTGMEYGTVNEKLGWHFTNRRRAMTYWPLLEPAQKKLTDEGITPVLLFNRTVPVRADYLKDKIVVYVDGSPMFVIPQALPGKAAIYLYRTVKVWNIKVSDIAIDSPYENVSLDPLVNDTFSNVKLAEPQTVVSQGVPFRLSPGERNMLNLKPAHWIDAKANPSSYYEAYDNGPPVMNDQRMPMIRIPTGDYTAAHVLAYSDDTEKDAVPIMTLRAGSYDVRAMTLQHDFAAKIPTKGQGTVETPMGKLSHTVIPMTAAFGQDIAHRPVMDIEVTKEVRLARRSPDPNRFRYKPQGNASAVRIAAITFEKSPLQIKVTSPEHGHAFELPVKPSFNIALENVTSKPQPFDITVTFRHLDGDLVTVTSKEISKLKGTVPVGQTLNVPFEPAFKKLGFYDIAFDINMPGVGRNLVRRTSFGVLPPDTRKHGAESPFGVWDFTGGHYSSGDPDQVGPIYKKAGIRYGMFRFTPEQRSKYGVLAGNEPKIGWSEKDQSWTSTIEKFYELHHDMPDRVGLILHENSISGNHVQRVPDIFHDRPAYKLQTDPDPRRDEVKRFADLLKLCLDGAKATKEKFPGIHLRIGNGPLPTKEELYRAGFPSELFDSGGNESGTYGRMPETQPPDWVGFGSSLWMDRQLLDHYGYKDKPVTQCYEICYPNTNPGNLTPETQADYFIRHAMHSLIWGIPEIRMGCISDVGNSYRFSNWGASGITYKMPELNIKPSFIAIATMTRMLDGAKFPRTIETGSTSLYAVEFKRPEPGTFVTCVWNVNGKRNAVLEFEGALPYEIIDSQGNRPESAIKVDGNKLTLTASNRPIFMVSKSSIKSIQIQAPHEPLVRPEGDVQVLVPASASDATAAWAAVEGRDRDMEMYNFMTPRRKGDFAVESVKAEGIVGENAAKIQAAMKITPKPLSTGKATMPMYTTYSLKKPVELTGKPTSIAVQVKGNSGWGRVIFELKDASGQVWRSIGAPQRGELSPWLLDWMPKELQEAAHTSADGKPVNKIADWNTDDVWGLSRINFDGWKYLDFPLPGNFPGNNPGEYTVWPANSQWKFDGDGVVKYPLTITGLTIEIPEKVLKLNVFEPVKDPSIQIGEVLAITRNERWLLPRSASAAGGEGFDRLPLQLIPRESD